MKWCSKCRAHHGDYYNAEHCPEWYVWEESSESLEDASVIVAFDVERAAERWAGEQDGEGQEALWSNGGIEVMVVKKGESEDSAVKINVHATVQYYAEEIS